MSNEDMEIVVGTNGVVEGIYKEELLDVYKKLGSVKDIKRASHIAWEDMPDGKGWTVRAAHDPRLCLRAVPSGFTKWTCSTDDTLPIAYFELRSDALAAEIEHFWDLLPGTKQTRKEVK